jgi:hypothetical protein
MKIQAVQMVGDSELEDAPSGAFEFHFAVKEDRVIAMDFKCPCGCHELFTIHIKPSAEPQSWEWNQSYDSPTMVPSINIREGHWHGWLVNGWWKTNLNE